MLISPNGFLHAAVQWLCPISSLIFICKDKWQSSSGITYHVIVGVSGFHAYPGHWRTGAINIGIQFLKHGANKKEPEVGFYRHALVHSWCQSVHQCDDASSYLVNTVCALLE